MYQLMEKLSNKEGSQDNKKLYVHELVTCINSTVTFFIVPRPDRPNTCEGGLAGSVGGGIHAQRGHSHSTRSRYRKTLRSGIYMLSPLASLSLYVERETAIDTAFALHQEGAGERMR
jgi:hypothetical protein